MWCGRRPMEKESAGGENPGILPCPGESRGLTEPNEPVQRPLGEVPMGVEPNAITHRPQVDTYLRWREAIPAPQEFTLSSPEEMLLLDSGIFDNGFLGIVKLEIESETPEQIREWIREYPHDAAILDEGVRLFEISHKLALYRLKHEERSRALLRELLDRLEQPPNRSY